MTVQSKVGDNDINLQLGRQALYLPIPVHCDVIACCAVSSVCKVLQCDGQIRLQKCIFECVLRMLHKCKAPVTGKKGTAIYMSLCRCDRHLQ